MIMGVLSDTHQDKMNTLPHIMREFTQRKVEVIIHCGDIIPKHLNPELFNGLPVVCALVEEQVGKKTFETPPHNWTFTRPGHRIYRLSDCELIYVGHKRSFDFLTGSENKLNQMLDTIRKENDWVRWLFSGHTHHQIFKQGHLINFVNPGAVEDSFDGYEFAVVNTDTGEIVFSRIPKTKPVKSVFSIGVISDSLHITSMDSTFWQRLNEEFKKRGVTCVIHCGNIALQDIGRSELSDFQVFYNLRSDQQCVQCPDNWHLISADNPVVEIEGYRFYVQLDLGVDLLGKSEMDMHMLCLNLRRKHPEISFVLCGFTNDAFFEEGQEVKIVNPGDILHDRNFTVISLPSTEITFGHVPVDPLP